MSGDRPNTDPEIDADTVNDYDTPLPPAALQTGAGSGLNADTLRGNTPSDLDGIWTLDGEDFVRGATSISYTLSSTYDAVAVFVTAENVSGTAGEVDLRINGETGMNYNFVNVSGGKTTGASQISRVLFPAQNESVSGWLKFTGRAAGHQIRGGKTAQSQASSQPVGWSVENQGGTLDSLKFASSETHDYELTVVGRNINGGGLP